jgi:hypothetical protein
MPEDFMKLHPANEENQITLTTRKVDVGPVLTYCKNDEVRRRTQHEYRSRCPGNIDVLQKILQGCHNKAQILGYPVIATRAYAGLESYQLRRSCSRGISYCITSILLVVCSLSSVITSIYPSPTFYITPGYVLTGIHRAGLPWSLLDA